MDSGEVLLRTARATIARSLGCKGDDPPIDDPWLEKPGACFVTLKVAAALRGCVGTLEARRPLIEEVAGSARAAAFEDARFPPLTADELDHVTIEVSVLSRPQPFEVASEDALLALLRPGVDGLILEEQGRRSTFLPQVWKTLTEPTDFVGELKKKAGLERDHWSESLTFARYTVRTWAE